MPLVDDISVSSIARALLALLIFIFYETPRRAFNFLTERGKRSKKVYTKCEDEEFHPSEDSSNQTQSLLTTTTTRRLWSRRKSRNVILSQINQYKCEKIVAKGATCIVQKSKHIFTGEFFAVKSMRRVTIEHLDSSLEPCLLSAKSSAREIAFLKKLRHKNIVSLHEVIDDAKHGYLYLVFEWADGGQLCKSTPGPINSAEQRLRNFRDICSGLLYLHKHNIVHRDIKCENCLLTSTGLKLCDFGVSHQFRENEKGFLWMEPGTLPYQSPELVSMFSRSKSFGEASYDAYASDCWALGVLLYRISCGHLPFYSKNRGALGAQILFQQIRIELCEDSLVDMICGLLHRDPKLRYSIRDAISHPYTTMRGSLPIECQNTKHSGNDIQITRGEVEAAFTPVLSIHEIVALKLLTRRWVKNFRQRKKAKQGIIVAPPAVSLAIQEREFAKKGEFFSWTPSADTTSARTSLSLLKSMRQRGRRHGTNNSDLFLSG